MFTEAAAQKQYGRRQGQDHEKRGLDSNFLHEVYPLTFFGSVTEQVARSESPSLELI